MPSATNCPSHILGVLKAIDGGVVIEIILVWRKAYLGLPLLPRTQVTGVSLLEVRLGIPGGKPLWNALTGNFSFCHVSLT